MITICMQCGRVAVALKDEFTPLPDFDHKPAVFWVKPWDADPEQRNVISHGLCPECGEGFGGTESLTAKDAKTAKENR